MKTPEQIKVHSDRFNADAWKEYTTGELGMWVHLLRKRAAMRTEPDKAAKDRADADNYEAMLRAALAPSAEPTEWTDDPRGWPCR